MNSAMTIAQKLLKWFVVTLVVVTAPVSIPLLLLGLVTEVAFLPGELAFKRRMHSRQRWLSQHQLTRRIEASPGTLIVDSPTISWGIARIWWTSDDLLAVAPMRPPTDDEYVACIKTRTWHPFYRWCWDQYLHDDHGRALLIGVWHSHRMADTIIQQNPDVRLVSSWSGSQVFETFANHTDTANSV